MNISVQLHHRLPPFVLPPLFFHLHSTFVLPLSFHSVLRPLLFDPLSFDTCVSVQVIRVPNVGVSMDVDARDDISLPALPKGNGSHDVSDE